MKLALELRKEGDERTGKEGRRSWLNSGAMFILDEEELFRR